MHKCTVSNSEKLSVAKDNSASIICPVQYYSVSLTCHTCIFVMVTVVAVQPIVFALENRCLHSSAVHVIQKDFAWSFAKRGILMGNCSSLVAKMKAYNPCISNAPAITTHCVPLVGIPYLNSTHWRCIAICQPYSATCKTWCGTCKIVHGLYV